MFPIRSYSFRTDTLPHLKQKFFKNNSTKPPHDQSHTTQTSPTIVFDLVEIPSNTTFADKQKKRLEKCLIEVLKSLKYLSQVISKKKYEIVANSTTFVLESILDVYNILMQKETNNNYEMITATSDNHDDLIGSSRFKVNQTLANLIRNVDHLFIVNESDQETALETLISQLKQEILDLIDVSINKLTLTEPKLTSSLKDLTKLMPNDDKTSMVKSISQDNIIGFDKIDNLALEISNSPSNLSYNSDYLMKKFENISAELSSNELSKCTDASMIQHDVDSTTPDKTVYKTLTKMVLKDDLDTISLVNPANSVFNYEIQQKNTIIKSRQMNNSSTVLSKTIDLKKTNITESNFYPSKSETNLKDQADECGNKKSSQKKHHISAYMSIFNELITNNSNSSPNIHYSSETTRQLLSDSYGQLLSDNHPPSEDTLKTATSVTVASINIDDLFNKCKLFPSDDSIKSECDPLEDKRYSLSSQSTTSSSAPSHTQSSLMMTNTSSNLDESFGLHSNISSSSAANFSTEFNSSVYALSDNEAALNVFVDVYHLLEYQNSELSINSQLSPAIPAALRGGPIDALIVLATSAEKKDFLYQEAFLTTYRTILDPKELILKLLYRYRQFGPGNSDRLKRKASKNSFALLVRVLDELGSELTDEIVDIFQNFVFELLISDQLELARILRKKLINKIDKRRFSANESLVSNPNIYIVNSLSSKKYTVIDFKSSELAEQMTLIDSELFLKIELSEVLLWSTKQSEELSPHLTQFTEHFNNISYWTRSRILELDNVREREKYMEKFLKIMKHLRKMNNFNSYLSILSGLDSGPVNRLDWPKSIKDTVIEYSQLIDPKCGFKRLREAVAESQPPCIPHIGLILQDLTFLNVANADFLQSGNCNFWKRWQQFNILERLRYFRNCQYNFKRNPKIIGFFNNFTEFVNEDAQYSLSERIKPRHKS